MRQLAVHLFFLIGIAFTGGHTYSTGLPAAEKREQAIAEIIMAFKKRDAVTIQKYIHPQAGFYLVPGPRVHKHFEHHRKIDFSNAYMAYHRFGDTTTAIPAGIKYESLPEYDCETYKWNKYGLYAATQHTELLAGIAIQLNEDVPGMYTKKQIKELAGIDRISKEIVLVEEYSDIIFYIAEIKGQYYITILDLQQTYCDI